MVEEGEDDYMSAEVLAACSSVASKSNAKKTKISPPPAPQLSKRAKREQLVQLMDDTRNTAQHTPLDASNKGFQMLQKFGYTSGGLGKDKRGMSEPLVIEKRDKADVTGIGMTSVARRQLQEVFYAKKKQRQIAEQWYSDFHSMQYIVWVGELYSETLNIIRGDCLSMLKFEIAY